MDCFTQTGHSCTRSYSVYRMEIEGGKKNILKVTTSDVSLYKPTTTELSVFYHTVPRIQRNKQISVKGRTYLSKIKLKLQVLLHINPFSGCTRLYRQKMYNCVCNAIKINTPVLNTCVT